MKKIAEMYGTAMIYGVCLVLVFGIVLYAADASGNEGILKQVGQLIRTAWVQNDNGGFAVYARESTEAFPDITYHAPGALTVGTYAVEDMIKAFDGAGRPLQCKVTGIKYPGASEATELSGVRQLVFEKQGIYELVVRVRDADNRKITKSIQIPVNAKKAG